MIFKKKKNKQIDTTTMENKKEVSKKIQNRPTIWSNNPTPGHIPGENHHSKRYTHPNVRHSTIYNSQDTEAT